jgi:hypothetical protein
MWRLPGSEDGARKRRLGALVVLAAGAALVLTTLKPDWPRDQTLIIRLPKSDALPSRLEASFVPVGAARAVQGFTLALEPGRREVRHQSRLPDGDYLVTIELTSTHSSGPSAAATLDTSEVRRVTLSGEETLIVLDGESSE